MKPSQRIVTTLSGAALLAATGLCAQAQTAASPPDHFSPKGKAPSTFTVEAQELQRKILPFADKMDFGG